MNLDAGSLSLVQILACVLIQWAQEVGVGYGGPAQRESAEPRLQMQWSPTCAFAGGPTLRMGTLRLGAEKKAQEVEGARTPSEPSLPKWCLFNSL